MNMKRYFVKPNKKGIILLFVLLISLYFLKISSFNSNSDQFRDTIPSDAMKSLEFWSAQRAYPERTIPQDKFYRAYEFSKISLDKGEKGLNTNDTWETTGPMNRGGRTNALVVDPNNSNIVYAGSASGGLWRLNYTSSSNYTWEYIDTGYPVLGVNSIAIDPSNSDNIYIGTGEVYGYQSSIGGLYIRTTRGSYGIGLLKSSDGGSTWTKSIDWSYNQQRGVLSLEINPLNPDVVFAGTSEGTYKSDDAGSTWTQVHSTLMAVDIAINPVDTNIVYISCGNLDSPGAGVYKSSDSGSNWQKLSGGLPSGWSGKTLLCIYKNSPNIIYADVGDDFATIGLYKSTDHGNSWVPVMENYVDYADYQGWFSHYVRVNPVDSSKLLIAGVQFYYSNDGGAHIYQRSGMHVDHHCYADDPVDPDVVWFGNDGGVYRSDDGGVTFDELNWGYQTAQFYNGFSSSSTNPDLALGGLQDNGTVKYTGSTTWIKGVLGGDGSYTGIDPRNNGVMYASSQYLNMYRSLNNGFGWNPMTGGINRSNAVFIAPFEIAHSNPDILYAGSDWIYRTENLGYNWAVMNGGEKLNGNPILSIGISHTDPDVVYAATVPSTSRRADVFRSVNGGVSWTNITEGLPDRYYVDLKVSPDNDQIVFITLSGFGSSHLYKSLNGGDSWIDAGTGLPDIPTSAVVIDPQNPQTIYLGNDLGVYVSEDQGNSWQEFINGLPSAVLVMDLSISESNRKIRAVTHGNGVYERSMILPAYVVDEDNMVNDFILYPNYPNPFNPETNIDFEIRVSSFVNIKIFNMLGQEVRTITAKEYSAGRYTVKWDGIDNYGKPVSSGSYIYVMKTENFVEQARMTLLR
ncbi:FlgD immunoglobulin-like domain containing protein [candidate division KSB1 bacterium]